LAVGDAAIELQRAHDGAIVAIQSDPQVRLHTRLLDEFRDKTDYCAFAILEDGFCHLSAPSDHFLQNTLLAAD
jgi:hypothetical protein